MLGVVFNPLADESFMFFGDRHTIFTLLLQEAEQLLLFFSRQLPDQLEELLGINRQINIRRSGHDGVFLDNYKAATFF